MNTNDFLQKYRRVKHGMNVTRPRVKCEDGYSVSIQAGWGIYSIPREDADVYIAVELGYPSEADVELMCYAENEDNPTNTVYGFVPVSVIDKVLEKHGGIVGADFSNDHAKRWGEH